MQCMCCGNQSTAYCWILKPDNAEASRQIPVRSELSSRQGLFQYERRCSHTRHCSAYYAISRDRSSVNSFQSAARIAVTARAMRKTEYSRLSAQPMSVQLQVVKSSALAASASILQGLLHAPQSAAGEEESAQHDVGDTPPTSSISRAVCILDSPIQVLMPAMLSFPSGAGASGTVVCMWPLISISFARRTLS